MFFRSYRAFRYYGSTFCGNSVLSHFIICLCHVVPMELNAKMKMKKKERISSFLLFEPAEGFGPPTPRLQITCSTAELRRQQLLTAFASAKIQKIFILTTFFKLFFIFFDIGFSRSYSVSSQRLSTKPHHSGNQQLAYPIIPKYVPNTQPCHH